MSPMKDDFLITFQIGRQLAQVGPSRPKLITSIHAGLRQYLATVNQGVDDGGTHCSIMAFVFDAKAATLEQPQ